MKLKSAFDSLLRRQANAERREVLHRARRELELRENDALWGLIEVVQQYCDTLESRSSRSAQSSAPSTFDSWRSWASISLAMSVQTLALALSYLAGAGSKFTPRSDDSWLLRLLSIPAGWMLLVYALPLAGRGIAAGWQARRSDPWMGWCLLAGFSIAITGFGAALWFGLSH